MANLWSELLHSGGEWSLLRLRSARRATWVCIGMFGPCGLADHSDAMLLGLNDAGRQGRRCVTSMDLHRSGRMHVHVHVHMHVHT